jgi:hypothetical protein
LSLSTRFASAFNALLAERGRTELFCPSALTSLMPACRKAAWRAARDSRRRKWRGRRRYRCTFCCRDCDSDPGPRAVVRDPPGPIRAGTRLAGLAPDRVIYVEAGNEKAVLSCFEKPLATAGSAQW